MRVETKNNINCAYNNVKKYLNDVKVTKELREMCKYCEKYCGNEHDYTECEDMMCFKFWLAYTYLDVTNSYKEE